MTSLSGSSAFDSLPSPPAVNHIFLIVGLACLLGFVINLLTAALPPDLMALEWRIGFMQQVSSRSVSLFLGLAMVVYGSLTWRVLSRYLALACLVGGILFLLSGVIVIRDGLVLQNQALGTIESEATEIRSQLQTAQVNPNLPPEVTPQRIGEALSQLEVQAEALSQNARSSATQSMMSMLSTQVVTGIGLLALGRVAIKHNS
ncbi:MULTISPECIES: hypothetical protein [Cyanophyceae]|uniref:HpsJ-like protein, cyanoexosortase C-associated n=1 Tax=Cyanophyceae TaxID=3028117 RepID=UPI0016888470|nr:MULTISPECIES: hypothetical protein [Cyanophyceae]MBD1918194.1 hypothetical protein [Phormidium sp. FACHB-77]MBD2030226.1 hypothetical protein [Phormidium sp. FACHB-322]MBD2051402.1 hypothetical protein [Leptolyngbya sp. FACHB-60]